MSMTPEISTPTTPAPPDLAAELEATLSDALRRASTRAEHIRLTRIQSLVQALLLGGASTA
jgi:hypothetical protein